MKKIKRFLFFRSQCTAYSHAQICYFSCLVGNYVTFADPSRRYLASPAVVLNRGIPHINAAELITMLNNNFYVFRRPAAIEVGL